MIRNFQISLKSAKFHDKIALVANISENIKSKVYEFDPTLKNLKANVIERERREW